MATEKLQFSVEGFSTLKGQIREATVEYQQLLTTASATPDQIKAAAARVAELKDQLDDANDAVSALTGAGKIQAFGKGISAIAGGFSAVQGAIALAGGEGKEFEKTMVKLQGAMALAQGLSQLEDLGNAFGNMKKVAVDAFQSIKVAIGSTGIGLLLVALGAIVVYWEDIKELVGGVSEEQKALNKETAANLDLQEKNLSAISEQENILKLQGKSEKEIYDLKLGQYDLTIEAAKANLEGMKETSKLQIQAAERNRDILKGVLDFINAPTQLLLKTIDALGKALGQDFGLEEKFDALKGGVAEFFFDPQKMKDEAEKTFDEAEKGILKLENQRAGLILTQKQKEKAAADARAAQKKTEDDKELKAQEAAAKATEKLRDEQYILAATTEEERARRTLEVKQKWQDKELQDLIKAYEAKKTLTAKEEETLAALRAQFNELQITQRAETEDLLLKQAEAAAKKQKEIDDKLLAEKIKNDEEELKAKKEKEKALYEMSFQSAQDLILALQNLNSARYQREIAEAEGNAELQEQLRLEYFERNKRFQYATAVITGIQSVLSAFAAGTAIGGPPLGAIYAAVAAGVVGLQLAAIQQTQYVGSGGGGGSTPEAGGETTQASMYEEGGILIGKSHNLGGIRTSMGELEGGEFVVNRRSTANFLPILEAINDIGNAKGPQMETQNPGQQIIKTYVVASEMTTQQEAAAKLSALARL